MLADHSPCFLSVLVDKIQELRVLLVGPLGQLLGVVALLLILCATITRLSVGSTLLGGLLDLLLVLHVRGNIGGEVILLFHTNDGWAGSIGVLVLCLCLSLEVSRHGFGWLAYWHF